MHPSPVGFRVVLVALCTVLLQGSVADARPPASPATGRAIPTGRAHAAAIIVRRVAVRPALLPVVTQPDILPRHQILADRVLKMLPSACRRSLTTFDVRYGSNDRRGYGGKSTIILDGTVPDDEFTALLVHECGHVIHANLAGHPASGPSGFRDGGQMFHRDSPAVRFFRISWERENVLRAGTAMEDFASGYARTDAFEDFAEFLVAYVLHGDLLRERAEENDAIAAKLAWMRSALPLTSEPIALDAAEWDGRVPWDMTKIPIRLSEETVALRAGGR